MTTDNFNLEETTGAAVHRAAEENISAAEADVERRRAAEREGGLAALVERVRAEGAHAAFEATSLDAVARLRRDDAARFVRLRDEMTAAGKAAGSRFPWGEFVKRLDAEERRAKEDARRAQSAADAAARELLLADAAAAVENARAEVPEALLAHFGTYEADDDTGACFTKEPGGMKVERAGRGGRADSKLLAAFSAVLRRDVHDVDLPGVEPRRTFEVGVVFPGERFERLGEVRADEFAPMRWPEVVFGARALVMDTGRRDDLRVAIQCMSEPVEVRRFRFTGWHEVDGRMVYLHRSGALGEGGPVAGVLVDPAGAARRFDFGDLSVDPSRGVAAVLELLAVEPASVVVTLVAASFRAAMGPGRLSVMVWGPTATGKSCVVGLAQSMFGATMHGDAMPASWADKSTENGIAALFARVGDAVVGADDMVFRGSERDDIEKAKRFDAVTRAHYNRAAPIKLNRDGSQRHERPSRCIPISTGESKPRGHSTVNRTVCVEMPRRSPTDLDRLKVLAADGVLARGMAAFVQWYAPRVKANLPRLDTMERAAAQRWGLGGSDRAGALFGALALGAEVLFAWLEESGVDRGVVRQHERRARAALAEVARSHGEGVEDANPARRFIPLLRDAFAAGEAHVKALLPTGATGAPAACEAWGWRTDGSDGPRHQGKAVGWVRGAEVFVEPGPALDVVKARAQRAGDPFPLDARALARDLDVAGLLARTDREKARGTVTCRVRVGAGVQRDALVFPTAAFGVGAEDEAPEAGAEVAPSPQRVNDRR